MQSNFPSRALPWIGTDNREHKLVQVEHNVPIFARHGNRIVAVNPALVRSVETQLPSGCKIVFDHAHELFVDASLYEVIRALWGEPQVFEMKELPAHQ